jgi:hypothetical protein
MSARDRIGDSIMDSRDLIEVLEEIEAEDDGIDALDAEDIGAIGSDASWPLYCIDWKQAARDLQMDYSAVEFMGQTYYVR